VITLLLAALAQARSLSPFGETNGADDGWSTVRNYHSGARSRAGQPSVSPQLLADDQTMRTTYTDFGSPGSSAGQSASSKSARSKLGKQAFQIDRAGSYSGQMPGVNHPNPSLPPYGSSTAGNGEIPLAVQRLTGAGHVRNAMPNPATMPLQGGESAQESEHQRVLNNMRAHGYSEARIKAVDPYIHQSEAPGTTYRNVMGIKVRNDGMTVNQAFNNIKNNGLMNTPISTDLNHYAPGTYGYYKTHGGRKTFGQWLDDGQR
jgi:hypothetical protein